MNGSSIVLFCFSVVDVFERIPFAPQINAIPSIATASRIVIFSAEGAATPLLNFQLPLVNRQFVDMFQDVDGKSAARAWALLEQSFRLFAKLFEQIGFIPVFISGGSDFLFLNNPI